MKQSQSKKTTWIIAGVGIVVAIIAACVAVFVFHLPNKSIDEEALAEAAVESSESASAEITPSTTDPMEVIKNYENFMMQYADYAEMLNSTDGIPASKAQGYADWLASFDDMMAQFEAVQNTDLTPEQEQYFDEVINRVDKRMKEATGSDLAGIPRSAEEAEEQAQQRQEEADRTAGRTSDDASSSSTPTESAN